MTRCTILPTDRSGDEGRHTAPQPFLSDAVNQRRRPRLPTTRIILDINFTLTGLVDIIGLVQGVVLGTVFMVRGRRHQSFVFLGLFMVGYAGSLAAIALDEWGILEGRPDLLFMPFNFYFSTAPALYLYVRSLTKGMSIKSIAQHMWPALVEFAVFSALFLLPDSIKIQLDAHPGFGVFLLLYQLGAVAYSIVYLIRVFYLARTHNLHIVAYYSNAEDKLLTWIQWIAGYVIVTLLVLLALILIDVPTRYPNLIFWLSFINVAFIYAVAITGLSQIRMVAPEDIEEEGGNAQIPDMRPYTVKRLDPSANQGTTATPVLQFDERDELRQIGGRINDREYYRDSGLTLGGLAQKLHYSQRRLSRLINEVSGTNFSAYIHQFRVAHAKRLLLDPAFANYTMTAIAEEVGFSSKATFYAVFKQSTGTTPLKFQRSSWLSEV